MNAVRDPDRLPARLPIHFAVLPRQMVRIVKDQDCRLEADMVFTFVGSVLSFIPGKFNGSLCIDEYV